MTEAETKKAAALEASVNWRTIIIVCITILSIVTIGGVVVIAVFGEDSGLALVIQILAFVVMIVGFLLGLLKIEQVHNIVNAKSTAQDEKIAKQDEKILELESRKSPATVQDVAIVDSHVTVPVAIKDDKTGK